MLTDAQKTNRKVGGSDIATILGLNPYKTAEELRLEILGRLPGFEGNDATEAGNIFEPAIADYYSHLTGRKLRRSNITRVRPEYPWLTGHIDRDVVGERVGLEIKNVHWRMAPKWGKPGTDEVPDYYLPQPHTYMFLWDYPEWDVAAYFGGSDLRIFTVHRDPEWDEIIIDASRQFWEVNVLQDVPCDIDPEHPAAESAVKRIYPGTDGSITMLPDSIEHWHQVRLEATEEAKRYSMAADVAKLHIMKAMGQSAIGKLPSGGTYTRKLVTRKGFTVEPSSYIDMRYSTPKPDKAEAA